MMISELIEALQEQQNIHGDIQAVVINKDSCYVYTIKEVSTDESDTAWIHVENN